MYYIINLVSLYTLNNNIFNAFHNVIEYGLYNYKHVLGLLSLASKLVFQIFNN